MLRELARARVLLELLAVPRKLVQVLLIGISQHRDEKSVVERDRDAEVDRLRGDQLLTFDPRTQPRVIPERLRARGHDRVRVRGAGPLARLVRRAHIDITGDRELRLLAHAAHHSLGDDTSHARERLAALTG